MTKLLWRSGALLVAICGCTEAPEPTPIRDAPVDATVARSAPAPAQEPPVAASAAAPAAPDWLRAQLAGTAAEPWLASAEAHRVQILVRTAGERGPVEHAFRVDAEYVYPASALKTFLSVAALLSLRERIEAPLARHPLAVPIGKLQRVSDNAAFTELYDFVGHRELNEMWWGLGFASVRFHHRMGGSREEGLVMPSVFVPTGGEPIRLAARRSDLALPPTKATRMALGRRHRLPTGAVVAGPMSFTAKNYVSLRDLQRLNVSLVEPTAPGAAALGLAEADRQLLLAAMGDMRGTAAQHKPLLGGIRRALGTVPIRYIGKAGRAYGFHIANAYVENTATQRAMYVTASIHVNPNGVMNDDSYDYDGSTQPFMTALGEALARALLR